MIQFKSSKNSLIGTDEKEKNWQIKGRVKEKRKEKKETKEGDKRKNLWLEQPPAKRNINLLLAKHA